MKRFLQGILIGIAVLAFIAPGYTYFVINHDGSSLLFVPQTDFATKLLVIFRLFGLYAFVLVWLQVMLGTLRIPLTHLFGTNMLQVHTTSGIFTLIFALTHPLLFYLGNLLSKPSVLPLEALSNYLGPSAIYGYFGVVAISLMILTVSAGLLRTRPFIQKYWRLIHYGNYIIFILAFFHSFLIGTDTRTQPLHTFYYFFAATYIGAVIYKWGYKRIYFSIRNNLENSPQHNGAQR